MQKKKRQTNKIGTGTNKLRDYQITVKASCHIQSVTDGWTHVHECYSITHRRLWTAEVRRSSVHCLIYRELNL